MGSIAVEDVDGCVGRPAAVLGRGVTLLPVSAKTRKQSANLIQQQQQHHEQRKQPSFGICFDIDGVLARGSVAIPAAINAFRILSDELGNQRLPVAFVTNSLNRNSDRAKQLSAMLQTQVSPDQLIQAQGPLDMFTKLHNKFCLVVGQGQILEIAKDLGFTDVCTIDDITDAYPLLDVVDHDNRKKIASQGYTEKDFRKIEAIILLGEPKRWESALQILVDVLRSDGRPNTAPTSSVTVENQLPVVACNMDLQFMHRASMPRFGHGAFLVCLEALYQKITGRELHYYGLVGKPSEITFRYAEHVLTSQSRKLGFTDPIRTMYLIGDTPDSDIVGANLYQRYVNRMWSRRRHHTNDGSTAVSPESQVISPDDMAPQLNCKDCLHDPSDSAHGGSDDGYDTHIPASRNVPEGSKFHRQTVEFVEPILVCTGVYRPPKRKGDVVNEAAINTGKMTGGCAENGEDGMKKTPYHGHRDFPNCSELYKPSQLCDDVYTAVEYILQKELFS